MDERPQQVAQRDLFAGSLPASSSGAHGVTLGISIWLVAAVALVAGIVIGFASGYTAGQRANVIWSELSSSSLDEPRAATGEPAASSPTGQAFTEGAVTDPVDQVRVDPEPIVTAPEPPPVGPEAGARAPLSRGTPSRRSASTGTPSRSLGARRAAPVEPVASGPGSLQI